MTCSSFQLQNDFIINLKRALCYESGSKLVHETERKREVVGVNEKLQTLSFLEK